LPEVLFVALAAVLCGATHCTEMALFAENRLELLRQFIALEKGAPSHDTFSRVLAAVDPAALNDAFMRFMAAFGEQARIDVPNRHVAIDGKSLRRAYANGRAHMPPLVVTAFACETFMSLRRRWRKRAARQRPRSLPSSCCRSRAAPSLPTPCIAIAA
jgi:hypothetical protein